MRRFLTLVSLFLVIGVSISTLSFSESYAATGVVGPPVGSAAASGLPAGCHIATASEVSVNAALAGRYVCPADAAAGITSNIGSAKEYLKSVPRQAINGSRCAPPESDENIERLNGTFAVCAAQFIKAYRQNVGEVVITSAFRDGSPGSAGNGSGQSANACAGGATGSNHQRGIAMDLHPKSGNYKSMWDFARANPQLGVCFPYLGGDRPHMALAGTGTGEAAKCAAQGVSQACSAGGTFDPDSTTLITSNTPTSPISDLMRRLLGGSQEEEQPSNVPSGGGSPSGGSPSGGGSSGGGSPASSGGGSGASPDSSNTCSPQFYCSGNTLYYRTSTCQEQPYQTCPSGCANAACIGPSGSNPLADALAGVTPQPAQQEEPTTTRSVFDQISFIAGSIPVGVAATSNPFVLTLNGEEATRLEGDEEPSEQLVPLLGNTYLIPPSAQETFISGDLRDSAYTAPSQTIATTHTTLQILKETLLNILAYLRPFGRPGIHELE